MSFSLGLAGAGAIDALDKHNESVLKAQQQSFEQTLKKRAADLADAREKREQADAEALAGIRKQTLADMTGKHWADAADQWFATHPDEPYPDDIKKGLEDTGQTGRIRSTGGQTLPSTQMGPGIALPIAAAPDATAAPDASMAGPSNVALPMSGVAPAPPQLAPPVATNVPAQADPDHPAVALPIASAAQQEKLTKKAAIRSIGVSLTDPNANFNSVSKAILDAGEDPKDYADVLKGLTPKDAAAAPNLFNPTTKNAVVFKQGKYHDSITDAVVAQPGHYVDPQIQAAREAAQATRAAAAEAKNSAAVQKTYQYNSGVLDKLAKPVDDKVDRFSTLEAELNQKTPQADALIAPLLLSATAGGVGSGVRITNAELDRVTGGATKATQLQTALNKWSTDPAHATFTDEQRNQMRSLARVMEQKLLQKQHIIQEAQDALVSSSSSDEHNKITAKAKKDLSTLDADTLKSETPEQRKKRLADQYK